MYKRSEGYFKGYQDIKLHFQKWEPEAQVKGVLVITHGHGEHSESYHRVVDQVTKDGWLVLAWDWRGHGKSEGIRGYASHFNDYVYDFEAFLKHIENDPALKSFKPVLLGHSMGGLIQLKTILNYDQTKIKAQVLSAPLLGVAVNVPAYKSVGAQVLNVLLPKMTLWNEVRNEDLSRDPLVIKEYEHDPLRHDRMSAGVYLGFMEAIAFVQSRPEKLEVPTLFQIPIQDPIVSSTATREFYSKTNKSKHLLKEYTERKHEIYNDLNRDEVLLDLCKFLRNYLS